MGKKKEPSSEELARLERYLRILREHEEMHSIEARLDADEEAPCPRCGTPLRGGSNIGAWCDGCGYGWINN